MRKLILLLVCVAAMPAFAALDVFITNADGRLMTNRFANSAWSGWTSLNVAVNGGPDATAVDGSPDVFYRGADNALWQLQKRRGTWGTPVRVGGEITSDPAAITVGNDLRVFARGTDAAIWQIGSAGARWGDWEPLGGEFPEGSAPDAETHGAEITVVARGMDRAIWANFWDGAAWSDWISLGGEFIGDPAVVFHHPQQQLEVYAVGNDRRMYRKTRRGSTWSGWDRIPVGEFNAGAALDAAFDGNVPVVVARGTDDGAWMFIGDTWHPLGGSMRANPAVAMTGEAYRFSEAPPRASARYRVVLNGFSVDRETNDDPLERHGARDEIYLYGASDVIGSGARTRILATRIFGDTHNNADHVRAGGAWNPSLVGARGGLMTGDTFPGPDPWERVGDLNPADLLTEHRPTNTRPGALGHLPMAVWEGELVRGGNVVVVLPAIVESDHKIGALPLTVNTRFETLARTWRSRLDPARVTAEAIADVMTAVRNAGLSMITVPRSGDDDRPIGGQPVNDSHYGWAAVPIVLTYDRAEAMVSRAESFQLIRNGTSITTTLPHGVSFIEYSDVPDLGGKYTLFWQVERVP